MDQEGVDTKNIFVPWPFDEEFATIFVLGILPKDLDPDPGNTDAIEGWLFTCLIGFCLVRETFSWLEISSQWLFSMLAAGDQLTYYWVTFYVHPRSARSRKPCSNRACGKS